MEKWEAEKAEKERERMSNLRVKMLAGRFKEQNYSCPVCDLPLVSKVNMEFPKEHHVLDKHKIPTGDIQLVHSHCYDFINRSHK